MDSFQRALAFAFTSVALSWVRLLSYFLFNAFALVNYFFF